MKHVYYYCEGCKDIVDENHRYVSNIKSPPTITIPKKLCPRLLLSKKKHLNRLS